MTIIEPKEYEWVSCNAPDNELPSWAKDEEYKKYDEIIYNGRIYKVTADITSENTPDVAINDYVDFGAVNSHAFCDELINSQTKKECVSNDKSEFLEFTINLAEPCDMFAFVNVYGWSIEFIGHDFRNVKNWYDYFFKPFDISLFKREVNNWWDYFFAELDLKHEKVIKTPYKISGEVTIRIYGINGLAALGMLVCGNGFYIGETLRGAQVGAISYTKKIVDEWGNAIIRKGKTAKKNQYEVVTDTHRTDVITQKLNKSLEAGLCVFSGDSRDQDGYDALFVYGILSEFDLAISTLDKSELTIGVEGVI